jgi:hypothetical protein
MPSLCISKACLGTLSTRAAAQVPMVGTIQEGRSTSVIGREG